MPYSSPPTLITGSTWTAADHNQYIVDNFSAIFPIIKYRQGVSTTSWISTMAGSLVNFPVSASLLQVGSLYSTSTFGYVGFNFVIPYSIPPIVIFRSSIVNSSAMLINGSTYIQFTNVSTLTQTFFWMALGEA